jgi:hypothetical protein
MAVTTGDWPMKILYTVKEYKKTRLKYFTKEWNEFETPKVKESLKYD